MRKSRFVLSILIMSFVLLGACGSETGHEAEVNVSDVGNVSNAVSESKDKVPEESDTEDLYVFWTESEALYSPGDDTLISINNQFYQGEASRIWTRKIDNGDNPITFDVFLYGEDGSCKQLAQNVSKDFRTGWFLDAEGNYFVYHGSVLSRLDGEGKEVNSYSVGGRITDICQLPDGEIVILFRDDDGNMKLGELDSETNEVIRNDRVALGENTKQYIGSGNDGLLLLNNEGVWEVNRKSGGKECLISFEEYAYEPEGVIMDFCMSEEGNIEIITLDEKITLQLVNISKTREIITLRLLYSDVNLEEAAARYNKENGKYYVLIEKLQDEKGGQEYITRTNLEIVSGSGPDILSSAVVEDAESLIVKGVLENLAPYMESSGIREEDYFPAAFDVWRRQDAIYGFSIEVVTQGIIIDKEFVKQDADIDVETLVDSLLAYPAEAVFIDGRSSLSVLDYLLSGSGDLWGMIDWESGKCDFNGALFTKMLQAAKRFGDDGKNDYPALAEYAYAQNKFYTYGYEALMEMKGTLYLGYFFDEGNYPAQYSNCILAMNSNSSNKEGVWEFFSFLLSEEVQSDLVSSNLIPVNRQAFEAAAAREIEEGALVEYVIDGRPGQAFKNYIAFVELEKDKAAYRELYDMTEAKVDELRAHQESVKVLPQGTQEIRNMIAEEAAAYFSGSKNIEQVISIIQNRVQLYLDENR